MQAITKARINRAIAHTGLTVQGNRSDGYFYFTKGDECFGESVFVCYLNQLSIAQWIIEAEYQLKQWGEKQ